MVFKTKLPHELFVQFLNIHLVCPLLTLSGLPCHLGANHSTQLGTAPHSMCSFSNRLGGGGVVFFECIKEANGSPIGGWVCLVLVSAGLCWGLQFLLNHYLCNLMTSCKCKTVNMEFHIIINDIPPLLQLFFTFQQTSQAWPTGLEHPTSFHWMQILISAHPVSSVTNKLQLNLPFCV